MKRSAGGKAPGGASLHCIRVLARRAGVMTATRHTHTSAASRHNVPTTAVGCSGSAGTQQQQHDGGGDTPSTCPRHVARCRRHAGPHARSQALLGDLCVVAALGVHGDAGAGQCRVEGLRCGVRRGSCQHRGRGAARGGGGRKLDAATAAAWDREKPRRARARLVRATHRWRHGRSWRAWRKRNHPGTPPPSRS
jgi:hypothetical protein